ncbi:hypothetical protein I4F81_004292 [Pyropia yezoensis]|uniref:Uncharacterized protein n=1 Tax=Pyropia yezoensis TaxID=2788 RepID=A0ACC3BW66_PYRYE|nr:hypothetical protein I4F81_004292 [Neopyropia yezoensis]
MPSAPRRGGNPALHTGRLGHTVSAPPRGCDGLAKFIRQQIQQEWRPPPPSPRGVPTTTPTGGAAGPRSADPGWRPPPPSPAISGARHMRSGALVVPPGVGQAPRGRAGGAGGRSSGSGGADRFRGADRCSEHDGSPVGREGRCGERGRCVPAFPPDTANAGPRLLSPPRGGGEGEVVGCRHCPSWRRESPRRRLSVGLPLPLSVCALCSLTAAAVGVSASAGGGVLCAPLPFTVTPCALLPWGRDA